MNIRRENGGLPFLSSFITRIKKKFLKREVKYFTRMVKSDKIRGNETCDFLHVCGFFVSLRAVFRFIKEDETNGKTNENHGW